MKALYNAKYYKYIQSDITCIDKASMQNELTVSTEGRLGKNMNNIFDNNDDTYATFNNKTTAQYNDFTVTFTYSYIKPIKVSFIRIKCTMKNDIKIYAEGTLIGTINGKGGTLTLEEDLEVSELSFKITPKESLGTYFVEGDIYYIKPYGYKFSIEEGTRYDYSYKNINIKVPKRTEIIKKYYNYKSTPFNKVLHAENYSVSWSHSTVNAVYGSALSAFGSGSVGFYCNEYKGNMTYYIVFSTPIILTSFGFKVTSSGDAASAAYNVVLTVSGEKTIKRTLTATNGKTWSFSTLCNRISLYAENGGYAYEDLLTIGGITVNGYYKTVVAGTETNYDFIKEEEVSHYKFLE